MNTDISKCSNNECTKKDTCYRVQLKANEYYQAYSSFKQDEHGNCEYYVPIKEIGNARRKKESSTS